MTVVARTQLPARRYYRLADAAKILDCTESDLLHFGAHNEIRIGVMIAEIVHGPVLEDRSVALSGDWGNKLVLIDGFYHYHSDYGTLVWDEAEALACMDGLWFLSLTDLSELEARGQLEVGAIGERGNWGPFWGELRLHNGEPGQCISVSLPFSQRIIESGQLYIPRQDMDALKGLDVVNKVESSTAQQKPLISEDRWFDVLGVMAVLLHEKTDDPRMRKGKDNNMNMSGMKMAIIDEAKKLGLSGERLENLNKDISTALKQLNYLVPQK